MKRNSEKVSVLFLLFSIFFCVCLIAANLLGTKQIAVGSVSLTGGLIVFPISYIINDCVCEVWGYKKTRMLIWVGFIMNFFFVHAIFGLAPRIAFASFLAFLSGSFVNAYVMSRMKIHSEGRNFPLRAVVSSILGEMTDSIIFFPLAFWGVIPTSELPMLMMWQVVLKTTYEVLVLPLTIRVVNIVKRYEGEDTYDKGISYNVLKVFNL